MNNTIRSIHYDYESAGLPFHETACGVSAVNNQVENLYNGLVLRHP